MPQLSPVALSRNVFNVALAYFMDARFLHDAASDLCDAGFQPGMINVAVPAKKMRATEPQYEDLMGRIAAVEEHTWGWITKRSMAHDRHRRGADQISGDDSMPTNYPNPLCPRIDLGTVLAAMNVSDGIVWLLEKEITSDRVFMLVDASGRVDEASAILKQNGGRLRTDYLKGLSA